MLNEEKMTIEITADEVITIDKDEYDLLRRKANVLDIMVADIKMKIDEEASSYSFVDSDLVLLLTGMKAYLAKKRKAEAEENARKDEADE